MPIYKTVKYTLKKRGDSWQFNVRVIEKGTPKRIRQQASSEAQAIGMVERIIDRCEAETTAIAPTTHQFSTPTLGKVRDLVLDDEWRGSRGEVTATKNAADCLKQLGENTPVDQVTTEDIDRMIRAFKDEELKSGTIRRKLAAIGRILHYAAERHWLKAMPLINRKRLGKENERQRAITEDEERRGMEFMRFPTKGCETFTGGPYCAEFFEFLIDTGLRLSEAVNLMWSKVDDDEWVRVLDNKGDYPRSVPATDRVKNILKDRRKNCPPGERLVWWDMTVNRAQSQWNTMRKFLKLEDDPDFVIHACRHTFASRLARSGAQLTVIKELGGWRTLAMVMRYAHLCPDSKAEAIRQMQDRQARKIG